ncbi:MAG: hypothetical protein AAF570_12265 [Bacteroidota bacterium]
MPEPKQQTHFETQRFVHNESINDLRYLEDGRRILSLSDSGVHIWDAKTGARLQAIPFGQTYQHAFFHNPKQPDDLWIEVRPPLPEQYRIQVVTGPTIQLENPIPVDQMPWPISVGYREAHRKGSTIMYCGAEDYFAYDIEKSVRLFGHSFPEGETWWNPEGTEVVIGLEGDYEMV